MEIKVYSGKTATAIKNEARNDLMNIIVKAISEALGKENVSQVGSSEYSVAMGITKVEGFDTDVIVNIKATAKPFVESVTAKKVTEVYDREVMANEYQLKLKEKAEKQAEKDRLKAEKMKVKAKAEAEKKEKEQAFLEAKIRAEQERQEAIKKTK